MNYINLTNINKKYNFNNIFTNLNLNIHCGDKISLIGPNGCGKSTLLKLLAKEEQPDSGTITFKKDLRIGYLKQINNERKNIKVKDYLQIKENEIFKRIQKIEQKMQNSTGSELEKLIIKYCDLQEELNNNSYYENDEIIDKTIKLFHIEQYLDKDYDNLSSGEKTLIELAKIMLNKPDLLLLDEPTNHLSIEKVKWLEAYLNNYDGTTIIVSHDRYFIDQTSNKIIYISNDSITEYQGNYSYFQEELIKNNSIAEKDYKNQQKEIKAKEKAIKQLNEWGRLGSNERFFKRAKNMEKQLDKMDKLSKPTHEKNINLNFQNKSRSGEDVLTCDNLNIIYDKPLITSSSIHISYGEHICLMGPNGSGKSSIIKKIINKEDIKLGTNIKIGYIPQEIHFPNENNTLIKEASKYFKGEEYKLRSSLVMFHFPNETLLKKLNMLSGGERVRLMLYILMQQDINFIILDEPTNHLDIPTKEILEEALLSFKGTILFVSHDRYFINKLATRIMSIENQELISYYGNYDDYLVQKNLTN